MTNSSCRTLRSSTISSTRPLSSMRTVWFVRLDCTFDDQINFYRAMHIHCAVCCCGAVSVRPSVRLSHLYIALIIKQLALASSYSSLRTPNVELLYL